MAEGYGGKLGIARVYALIFGIAYVGVALLEDIIGTDGWRAGSTVILKLTAVQNVIHWAVGIAVLGLFFVGEVAAKMVARVVGLVFVVVTIWGFVARTSLGKVFGFHGPLPWSYNIIHLLTAAFALFAGFAAERAYAGRANTAVA